MPVYLHNDISQLLVAFVCNSIANCTISLQPPCCLNILYAQLKCSVNTAISTICRFIFSATRGDACRAYAVSKTSVCLSICPSVCNVGQLWSHSAMHRGYFDTTCKGNHSSFLVPTVVDGPHPFQISSEICAQSDPPPSKHADFDRFPLITSQP